MVEFLDFSKEYILENNHVLLIPLKVDHLDALLKISNDQEIWRYLHEEGKDQNSLANYIEEALENRRQNRQYPFVVFDKLKKAYAGTTRLYEYNREFKTIKLGHTWYGKHFRGTYINKNCKYLLFQFIFEELDLERIGFGVHRKNTTSLAALNSLGCKQEGVLRSLMPSLSKTDRVDIILFSLLKNEWHESVKKELYNKLKTSR